ncbi:hypothetical protein ACFWYW_14490 [Nonomuraea sp. NPDC059023]|uniref:hypothetical protein n=1 Tax=unclassified Nonomuraea TaxID=2593643 RepID=UPI00368719A5
MQHTQAAWMRLGDLLVARRRSLGRDYRNRKHFAEETGLDYKIISDLESGRRANYSAATLLAIESAYRWQFGSVQAVLAGGQPAAIPLGEGSLLTPIAEASDGHSRRYEFVTNEGETVILQEVLGQPFEMFALEVQKAIEATPPERREDAIRMSRQVLWAMLREMGADLPDVPAK